MTKKKPKSEWKKNGRPTVMTDDVVGKVEHALAIGANISMACAYAGICRDTLYEYINKHPEYSDRIAMLKQTLPLKAVEAIAKAIKNGDTKTAQWVLEKKCPDEYGVQKLQLSGDVGVTTKDANVADMVKDYIDLLQAQGRTLNVEEIVEEIENSNLEE